MNLFNNMNYNWKRSLNIMRKFIDVIIDQLRIYLNLRTDTKKAIANPKF